MTVKASNDHRRADLPETALWRKAVHDRLTYCEQLPDDDWDGYGGRPCQHDVAVFALNLLDEFMSRDTPSPQIVPSSEGGIQIEWHEQDLDLELYLTDAYACSLWFHDLRGEEPPLDLDLTADFTALRRPISLLTTRA